MRSTSRFLVWLGGTASTPTLGLDLRPPSGAYHNVLPSSNTAVNRRATQNSFQAGATSQSVAFLAPEQRQLLSHLKVGKPQLGIRKFSRILRPDIYDELLKLPLRYALHDFDTLQRHLMEGGRGVNSTSNDVELEEDEVMPGVYSFPPKPSSSSGKRKPQEGKVEEDDDKGVEEDVDLDPSFSSQYYSVSGRQPSSVGYAPPLGPADPLDVIPFFVHRTGTGQLPGRVHSMDAKRLMPAFYLRIGLVDGDIFRFEEELLKIFPTKKIFVRRHAVYVYNVNLDGKAILHHWLLGLGF